MLGPVNAPIVGCPEDCSWVFVDESVVEEVNDSGATVGKSRLEEVD